MVRSLDGKQYVVIGNLMPSYVEAGRHIPRLGASWWQKIPVDRSGRSVNYSDYMLRGSAHGVPTDVL